MKKTQKNNYNNLLPALLSALLFLAGCRPPFAGPDSFNDFGDQRFLGSISIDLESKNRQARTLLPTNPLASDIDYYKIQISGPTSVSDNRLTELTKTFTGLGAGLYTVTVEGYTQDDKKVAFGEKQSIVVSNNVTTPVGIEIEPLMTVGVSGDFNVTVDWSAVTDSKINSVEASLAASADQSPQPLNKANGLNSTTVSGSLESGYYLLSVTLKHDATVRATVTEVLQIFDNRQTQSVISLSDADFDSPPAAPDNLILQQDGLGVFLRWNDLAKTEEEYLIYRRKGVVEEKLANLSFGATHYTDSPVEKNQTCVYWVVAKNRFGEAKSSEQTITIVPPLVANNDPESGQAISVYRGYDKNRLLAYDILGNDIVAGVNGKKIINIIPLDISSLSAGITVTLNDNGNTLAIDDYLLIDTSNLTGADENAYFTLRYTAQVDPLPSGATASDYQDSAVVTVKVGGVKPILINNDDGFEVEQRGTLAIPVSELTKNDDPDTVKVVKVKDPVNGIVSLSADQQTVYFTSTGQAYERAGFTYEAEDPGSSGNKNAAEVEVLVTPLKAIKAYVFDNESELQAQTQNYAPPTAQANIFNTWGVFYLDQYWDTRALAEGDPDNTPTTQEAVECWELKHKSDHTPYISYKNNRAPSGFISPDTFDNYSLAVTLKSTNEDNDIIGILAAFTREGNKNYGLVISRGGSPQDDKWLGPRHGWGLHVYEFTDQHTGKDTGGADLAETTSHYQTPLYSYELDFDPDSYGNDDGGYNQVGSWGNGTGTDGEGSEGNTVRVKVVREGNKFTFYSSKRQANGETYALDDSDFDDNSIFTLDLGEDTDSAAAITVETASASTAHTTGSKSALTRFKGARKYGYYVCSQPRTSYEDIKFSVPGLDAQKVYYIDPRTNVSKVYTFNESANAGSGAWQLWPGRSIQDELGYVRVVRNPINSKEYTIFKDFTIYGTL